MKSMNWGIFILFLCTGLAFAQGNLTPDASFLGTHSYERVGYHLHSAGDINNDGYDDFLIGTFHNRTEGQDAGAAYLFLGKRDVNWGFNRSISNADARFLGEKDYDAVGYNLGGGGDVNGDGYDDMLIGSPAGNDDAPENPGHLYVMFGKSSPNWGYNFILPRNADAGFDGEDGQDLAGLSSAFIGDMNGDGYDDIICGAPYNDHYRTDAGKVYIILGKASGWSRGVNLQNTAASFCGTSQNALAGYAVDGVGDVNGDGIPDIAIGARGASKVYLIFGRRNVNWGHNCSLDNADVIFYSSQYQDWTGWRVSRAGDVNRDGFDDIVIGAPLYNYNGSDAGKIFLIFGRSGNWNSDLANADASFLGERENDQAGWDVQDAGDVNGDGYDDFVIGAWYNDANGEDSGKMYLIKGKASGWQRNVSLSHIEDYFVGEHAGDYAGFSAATAGDINNDGLADIITSETYNSQAAYWAGKIVVFVSEGQVNPQPLLAVEPVSLDFGATTTEQTFTISNAGGGALNWNLYENPDQSWITSVTPTSGSLNGNESVVVTVAVDRSNMAEGNYSGTITINSNGGNQNVIINMTVPGAPELAVSPTTLNFQQTSTQQTFTVTNSGGAGLEWQAYENPAQTWISSINPASGMLGNGESVVVTVRVDRSGMDDGNYSGLITVTSNGGTQNVTVNMSVDNSRAIIYVKHPIASPSAWQGRSPVYTSVAAAINAANDRSDIWVAAGEYNENIVLINGISLYGGFDGDEGAIDERGDVLENINKTTINGHQAGSCIVTASNNIIDGFKLINGEAERGAGINVWNNTDIEMRNLFFQSCTVTNTGAGINIDAPAGGSILIERVIVWDCKGACGALESSDITTASVTMRHCTVVGNDSYGLEIAYHDDQPLLSTNYDFYNCISWENKNSRQSSLYSNVWGWARDYTDYTYIGNGPWLASDDAWGAPLPHNIFEDNVGIPEFVDPDYGDFHLKSNSPCINAGRDGTDMGALPYVGAVLSVNPTTLDFGYEETTKTFVISNSGEGNLTWNAAESVSWITAVTPASGSLNTGGSVTVTVTVSRAGLSDGAYEGIISINSNAGNETVTVQMKVGNPVPIIAVSPTSLSFAAEEDGANPPEKTIMVTNSGDATLNWTATEAPEQTWMILSNTSGTSGDHIIVAVNVTGLAVGTYNGIVRVSDPNASNSPVDVPVTLTIREKGPVLAEFEAEQNAALPNAGWQSMMNEGENCLLAAVNSETSPDEQYRLDYNFSVSEGITTVYIFAEIDVNNSYSDDSFWVKMNGGNLCKWNNLRYLKDGWKRAWVFNQGADEQHPFPVNSGTNKVSIYPRETGAHINWLVVTTDNEQDINNYEFGGGITPPSEDPMIDVDPNNLTFTETIGTIDPASQTITVNNSGGGMLNWSAAEYPEASWMTLTNTTGGNSDQVTVSVDIAGLAVGTYNGMVRISDPQASNSPADVPITLIINSPPAGSIIAEFEAESNSSLPNSGWEILINEGQNCLKALVSSTSAPDERYCLNYYFTVPAGVTTIYAFAEVDVNNSGENDSFWVKMNNADQCQWNNLRKLGDGWKRSWVYNYGSDSQHAFAVNPGQNKLSLYPREYKAHINWLVLTSDNNLNIQEYQFGGGAVPTEPVITVSPTALSFTAIVNSTNPPVQRITVTNSGGGTLNWTASEAPEVSWMNLQNTSGGSGGYVDVAVDATGLGTGTYQGAVRISDPAATNNPVDVPVTLAVIEEASGPILAELEAESSPQLPNPGWEVLVNDGQNCIKALVLSEESPSEQYRLDYTFNVPANVSTVYIFAEIDVNKSLSNDSFWIKMNNADLCKWNNLKSAVDGWTRKWVYNQGVDSQHSFAVTPGINTISLYPREYKAHINWLVVTTDADLDINNFNFGSSQDMQSYAALLNNGTVGLAPAQFKLHQNYPNPFNPLTNISFDLPTAANVQFNIYNTLGQEVKILLNQHLPAGWHTISWDATDEQGNRLHSGMFIGVFTAGEFRQTIKMIMLK